jgi:ubiquinone/menaquinone biosynthesis C-methylase UbiE
MEGSESSRFDAELDAAVRSQALADLFRSAFDPSAVPGVLGFSFVTMGGLARVADRLRAGRPAMLLDAGCGWGGPGLWVAQRLGCSLQGIDFSATGVRLAGQRAGSLGVDARFGVGTLDATGLADGFADAVMSVDALHFAPDPVAAGRELLRVTRPGSMLVATLWQAPRGPERLTRDHAGVLAEAGWLIEETEEHPEWLEAQIRVYRAAAALPAARSDAAVARLAAEGERLLEVLPSARRLMIVGRHPH